MTIYLPTTGEAQDPELGESSLRDLYATFRTVAVVGASADERKEAHIIPAYIADQGYQVIAVNPRGGDLFGRAVAPSLAEIAEPLDVVDVFRPPSEGVRIAQDAAAAGASVLWFQPETESEEAVRAGTEAGLLVVTGHCIGCTHQELGLGPGPG